MYAKRETWANVSKGKIIKSREGELWKVEQSKPGFWGLRNRAGETKILPAPKPAAAVDIMYLTQAECEAQLRDDLGAELYEVLYDDKGVWQCLPFEDRRIEEMKSHLLIMHGVSSESANDPGISAGMNSKKALIECHNAQHADPGPRYTPHIHTKEVDW